MKYKLKKKHLLQEWEKVKRKYYSILSKSKVADEYKEWFDDDTIDWGMEKKDFIEELIESELDCRRDDTIEELKEIIEHIKSLIKDNN